MTTFAFSPGCCCCTTLFLRDQGPNLRAYRIYGTHPNNRVILVEQVSANGAAVDWRNNLVFHSDSTINKRIFRNNFSLSKPEFVCEFNAPVANRRTIGGMACDWLHKKLYYSTLQSEGTPPSQTHQIRRVNYDGTNDELVLTQTWNATAITLSQNRLRIVPESELLFFWVTTKQGSAGSTNLTIQLHRCDLDGGGLVELYSQNDAANINRRYTLAGFDVLENRSQLVWAQLHDSFSNDIPKESRMFLSDYDAGDVSSLLSIDTPTTAATQTDFCPAYSERDGDIYYGRLRNPSAQRSLKRFHIDDPVDLTGDSHQTVAVNTQMIGAFGGGTLSFLDLYPGCALEDTGSKFSGAA